MGVQYTEDQQKVIDLHQCNILVSAAAGSGKTAVLVERIIQMICNEENQVDIDRVLIVTFTNAAAAEMRERISQGIATMQEKYPESAHIERQATLLHNALITTIDSFSLYLIRNHFQQIGLDPAFRVADEGEIKLLKQDVLAELLEKHFCAKEEAFEACVEFFCPTGREKNLEDIILKLQEYADSTPWPEEWLEECRASYNAETVEDLEASLLGSYLQGYLRKMCGSLIKTLEQVKTLCEQSDGPYMYGEPVEAECEMLAALCKCTSLQEWETKLQTVVFKTLPSKKDDSVNADKRELAKAKRNQVKEAIKKMNEQFFAVTLSGNVEQIKRCKGPVNTLLDLTVEFAQEMQKKKKERKILDFSDMEHYALDILWERDGKELRSSKVALEYQDYFREVMIDEYQDSNLVQEYLLLAVSGEGNGNYNRFMVGDVKQSIYKFRLANPKIFMDKYNDYTKEDGEKQRIDLSKNFRSRDTVIDTVNHVFERLMSEEAGGIAYDENAALYAGLSYPENEDSFSELLLLNKPEEEEELDVKEAEARLLAKKIKELKAGYMVTPKGTDTLRPAEYSDMVILLRTTSGWDETFKKVLEQEGIPVYITSKTGYFAATEVQELLQFLRVLDNPRQDIPLFGTMKSIFGGFTEEEIATIRCTDRKASLWDLLCAQTGPEDSNETEAEKAGKSTEQSGKSICAEKAADFVERIRRYRKYAVYMPIRELLQTIVEESGYLHYVSALPGGSKRKINVEMLFVKAADFEKTSYFGLFHFVRYIEQLEKYDVDFGQDDMLDENADVVRIMSIHKSKGLEFPITFVSGLGKKFNMMDVNKSFLMDIDWGIGTDYVNAKERYRSKTIYRTGLAVKQKEENLAEELRVLYVALTRAREKLIMTAVLEDAREKWDKRETVVQGVLPFERFMSAGSFMDYLLPVLDESVVNVSFYTTEDLEVAAVTEQLKLMERKQVLEERADCVDDALLAKLQERFAYTYQYGNLQGLYTKTTVSELKIAAMADKDEAAYHQFEKPESEPILPVFMRGEKGISATDRGNAYHKVMEIMDFELFFEEVPGENNSGGFERGILRKDTKDMLEELLQKSIAQQVMPAEYGVAVNKYKLLHFLETPLAKRMWEAQKRGELYREQPFVLGIAADKLNPDFPAEEKVLIQGIIDAFFVEDGEIVLLDYKTDKVLNAKELWDRYEAQLDYYEEALSKLMQMPVKERILYSFSLEECVTEQ